MSAHIAKVLSSLVGVFALFVGLIVPPSILVQMARMDPTVGEIKQLIDGAWLFKIGLVIFGMMVIALGRMPFWQSLTSLVSSGTEDRKSIDAAVLVIVLTVALALRLYALDSGLWLDEITTYVSYARMPFWTIVTTYLSENQNFLYSVLAHASFAIFGESAWSLRLPAVLFGVGSIWALYLFAREVGDRREALLSATLLVFSYHHVWFSQNARGYTGLLFWTLLSSWLIMRAFCENNPHLWLAYALCTAFGVYTHMTMLFVIAGQFIVYMLWMMKVRHKYATNIWRGFFLGFCLSAILIFLLHAFVLPQILSGIAKQESIVSAWKRPVWTLLEIIRGLQFSFANTVIGIGALVVFSAGFFSYARSNPRVVQLLVIPPLVGSVTVMAIGHHLWPRFFFFALGFGAIVIIRGFMLLGQRLADLVKVRSENLAWMGIAFSLGLILISGLTIPAAYGPKQDYQGALVYIESNRQPGDAIVTVDLAILPFKEFYGADWEAVESSEELDHVRSQATRTWLVYTLPPVLESARPDIMSRIRKDFVLVETFAGTLSGGEIFVCIAEAPSSINPMKPSSVFNISHLQFSY